MIVCSSPQGKMMQEKAAGGRKLLTMATITEKEFKSILNKYKFIDSWFWLRYGINPYHGCRFGCIYCDSRSSKYRLPVEFEDTIIVKKNIKEMLDRRLSKARTLLPDVVGVFGATDPYQPAEADYKNTRQCLEVLAKHRYPVHTVTKSKLVLRDLDLLETVGGNNWCTVSVTITTTDPDMARFLEKRAPSPQARFDVIKTIKERTRHVQAGVLLIPVVPVLCDSGAALEEMFKRTKAAGELRPQTAQNALRPVREVSNTLPDKTLHPGRFQENQLPDRRKAP